MTVIFKWIFKIIEGSIVSKKLISFVLIFLCLGFSNAYSAIDSSWLVNQQNMNGSFSAENDIALQVQNTFEVLQTLYVTGDISLIDESLALQIVGSSDSTHLVNLIRKIKLKTFTGQSSDVQVAELKKFISKDGGFSSIIGYQSTVLDTALAIQAWAVSGGLLDDDFSFAVGYLLNKQNVDGSWSADTNASSVFITALVSQALQSAQLIYNVTENINDANAYLLSTLQANLATTENYEIALAILSVSPVIADKNTYQFLIDQLSIAQSADDSWGQDIYTTALVLRAFVVNVVNLPLNKNLSSVIEPSSVISAVTGIAVDNLTALPLSGVDVIITLQNGSMQTTTTGVNGGYTLSQLPSGGSTISFSYPGYHTISVSLDLISGVIHKLNPVLISKPQPVPLSLKGRVIAASSGCSGQLIPDTLFKEFS